jgi:hypothetical protein
MQNTSKPQKMQNTSKNANATDQVNLASAASKRPVIMSLRDPRTKQYNETTIYVEIEDNRDDQEIIQEYKSQLKLSRELHREKLNQFKLTKNPNGTTSGRVFNWSYKDPSIQMQLDLQESLATLATL